MGLWNNCLNFTKQFIIMLTQEIDCLKKKKLSATQNVKKKNPITKLINNF